MTATDHPRHQAQRGRPGPDRRAGRGPRRCGRQTARPAARRWRRCPTPASATCSGRRSSAPGRPIARAAARLRREGDARGRRAHRRGPTPDAAYEDGRARRRRRGVRRRRACAPVLDGARRPARRPGWSNALAAKLVALTVPGVPGRLPGHRAVGAEPGRPGQPPAGRLRRRAERARPRARRRAAGAHRRADDHGHAKLLVTQRGAAAAPRPARAVHGVRRRAGRRRRPPTTCSPSTAAARSPSATRLPVGLAARGGWGDTALACPTGAWPTCSPAGRTPAGHAALADLLADLPGGAAGPRGR